MKGDKYLKILAKVQVSAIFLYRRDIRRNNLLKFIELCVWRRHVGAHPDGGQKPTEKSVIEFCFISQETHNKH